VLNQACFERHVRRGGAFVRGCAPGTGRWAGTVTLLDRRQAGRGLVLATPSRRG